MSEKLERIAKTGECRNTQKDRLKLINGILDSSVKVESLIRFPSTIYFNISTLNPDFFGLFETITGFKLSEPIIVQVNSTFNNFNK